MTSLHNLYTLQLVVDPNVTYDGSLKSELSKQSHCQITLLCWAAENNISGYGFCLAKDFT